MLKTALEILASLCEGSENSFWAGQTVGRQTHTRAEHRHINVALVAPELPLTRTHSIRFPRRHLHINHKTYEAFLQTTAAWIEQ